MRRCLKMLLVALSSAVATPSLAAEPEVGGIELFEKKIRPVLVEHCYACHAAGAKKIQGGFLLDTRAGLRKGGKTGPALVPGKVNESLLIKALRYEDPEMPPKGKLPAAVIADFEKWVAMGAPDPRETAPVATKTKAIDFAAARQHWAYQPILKPSPASVRDESWPTSLLDRFILAKLEANGLSPSAPADRRTLIRRAYVDLIGLPPTFEEVQTFQADSSPNAFAKVVDRLLDSPHYGERWGRHWLDVARYSDTKDFVVLKDRGHPYAYTYRDYVIRALNADVPYDRFIHEQLAADLIEPKVSPPALAAMGFLTLGRNFDGNIHDIYDDRIDTVSRGLLGLTVACARCHDHKYDAIPTQDYYALYGVFASSEQPLEPPLIETPRKTPSFEEFQKKAAPLWDKLFKHVDVQYQLLTETARQRVADYLLTIATEKPDPLENAVFFRSFSPEDLRPQITARWRRYLEAHASSNDAVFGPWHELLQVAEESFPVQAEAILSRWRSRPAGVDRGAANPLVVEALAGAPLAGKADVARRYGELFKRIYNESKGSSPSNPLPACRQLLDVVAGQTGPIYFPKSHAYLYMSRVDRELYSKTQLDLDQLADHSPGAPARAMALVDAAEPYQPRVFLRGSPTNLGDPIPRRFLRVLSKDDAVSFSHGSGRLELAKAITAPANPLTSRIIVNRVWMHHFGEPLVQTPSDFGVRSEPPSHPELLDYLAWTLQHDGWSLKKLHRLIMLSGTYQQSSSSGAQSAERGAESEALSAGNDFLRRALLALRSALRAPRSPLLDPENRYLWRMNRRRLDLEAMRDSLLAISGRLDRTIGGRPTDLAGDPKNRRRTIYGKVDRQDLPALYRAFDFANPDQTIERRPRTTVPQQALFAMNSPFAIEQAKALVERAEVFREADMDRRIAALYRIVLQREPERAEMQSALRFLRAVEPSSGTAQHLTPWQQYAQVLLLTNELMFVD